MAIDNFSEDRGPARISEGLSTWGLPPEPEPGLKNCDICDELPAYQWLEGGQRADPQTGYRENGIYVCKECYRRMKHR